MKNGSVKPPLRTRWCFVAAFSPISLCNLFMAAADAFFKYLTDCVMSPASERFINSSCRLLVNITNEVARLLLGKALPAIRKYAVNIVCTYPRTGESALTNGACAVQGCRWQLGFIRRGSAKKCRERLPQILRVFFKRAHKDWTRNQSIKAYIYI